MQVSVSSGQQAEVGRVLVDLGFDAISEFVDPLTGYSYDFWIPAEAIALEFDGPFHFCRGTRFTCFTLVQKYKY
jgi:hypothetical protein